MRNFEYFLLAKASIALNAALDYLMPTKIPLVAVYKYSHVEVVMSRSRIFEAIYKRKRRDANGITSPMDCSMNILFIASAIKLE
ncbi:TPA: hypothetical protein I7743_00885 [Vibrio vulnificus]|nr:hypothetical protein [Vibrio vulnificus]